MLLRRSERVRHVRRMTLIGAGWAAVVTGCGDRSAPAPPAVRPVKIVEVGERAPERREYSGRIRAAQVSETGFEVGGRIIEFPVKEGDRVAKGQQLARLDARDYEAALRKADAKLRHAVSERDKAKTLFEKNISPKSEYELRERLLEVEQAHVASAKKAVEDTVL